jgi:proteasome lid subunit RPN8/RPN11
LTDVAVQVRRAALDELLAHARAAAPDECCGLLIGRPRASIDTALRARNRARLRRTRYLIDPRDHFAALRLARERGAEVVGFYHSHPASEPAPSARDRARAAYPGHYYLIVSPDWRAAAGECVAAWQLDDSGNFVQVALVPIP